MKMEDFYSKLSNNDAEQFFPIFDSKDVIIDNVENVFKLTLLNYTQIDLNEVAYTILTMCTGENSVGAIIAYMTEIYDAPKSLIQQDTYKILYDFWTNGIIIWKNNMNFYSVLYENKFGTKYKFKLPVISESIKSLEQLKDQLIYDIRYNPEIKFSSAYLEKSMKTDGMQFFECWDNDELLLMYSCTPDISYLNNKEIVGFQIDAFYGNTDKIAEVKEIWLPFTKWVLSWFDQMKPNESNIFSILIEADAADTIFTALDFEKKLDGTLAGKYYEIIVEG